MNQDRVTIPDWKLERYVLGELLDDELGSIRNRVASDDLLKARLQTIENSNEELRASYPTALILNAIQRKLESKDSRLQKSSPSRWLLMTLPAAAAIVLFLYPRSSRTLWTATGSRVETPRSFFTEKRQVVWKSCKVETPYQSVI